MSNATAPLLDQSVVPEPADIEKARAALEALDRAGSPEHLALENAEGRMHAVLPVAAVRLLHDLLREIAAGHTVTLVPTHAELTTQQAADAVNVSRPFLVKLLESGDLPYRKVGTHRRVRFDDLMRYKRQIDAKRLATLNDLARESRELGLYD